MPDLTVISADILTSPHNLTNMAAVSVPSGVQFIKIKLCFIFLT